MDNQHPQSQFPSIARQEEPSHYSNQYSQPFETHYQDGQQASIPTSGFQNYQTPVAPLNRPPMFHQQEPASISPYAQNGHFSFTAKDGALGGEMNAAYSHHQGTSNSSGHQQEVPSSYSSVPGKIDGSEGQQHGHSLLPADGRAVQMEPVQFGYGRQSLDPMDQPLDFAPRFSHESDPRMKPGYPDSSTPSVGLDSVGAVPSLHAWTAPVAPGASYPPITPVFPSAQHDLSIGGPPLPGHAAPMFGRGPNFQPPGPSISPTIGLAAATALHPTAAFPVDAYGVSLGSERPKKAAVPNWLREEIIKKKATITSSVPEHSIDGSHSIEDDAIGKSTTKGDQADSRSMDSSRSAEEEDDDEDYEAAQRTAAINQEIKRVLTEVLLKVTDELFDEIATKVLSEDDLTTDVMADPDDRFPIQKASPPPPSVPAPKASARVLVPAKGKESGVENDSGESSSGSPGNLLGLANYASDDDEDVNQNSKVTKSDNSAGETGHSPPEVKEHSRNLGSVEGDRSNGSVVGPEGAHATPVFKLNDHRVSDTDLGNGELHDAYSGSAVSSSKKGDNVADDGKGLVKSDAAKSTDKSRKALVSGPDVSAERLDSRKSSEDDSRERDDKRRDKHESRKSSGRDITKDTGISKERDDEKAEGPGRREERHQKKDKTGDHSSSKEKLKEQGGKHRDKTKESDSRKRSPHRDDKDSRKGRERDRRTVGKDDGDRKRERTKDEKTDKSRHKSSKDRDSHKRRRSSSVSSRGRQTKESDVSDGSVDDASEDSRRKGHSKRRNLSPSPDRSKRRQVSRSPHSKHSQRRHSPYSSLEGNRGRRSRSRSPTRRHR